MLVIYKKNTKKITIPEQTSYSEHSILERQDIEKWIAEYPKILGEELLILTTEYDKFDKTNERLDLLAIDRDGTLVIIELKRDDSGKDVEMQAIKYAAYCSTLTFDEVVKIHKEYLDKQGEVKSVDDVRSLILNFIQDSEFEQINDKPRIIIVSNNYRPEVTASVLWLRKFGIEIKCIRLIPYEIDSQTLGLEAVTIIPLPEAEDFLIKSEQKDNQVSTLSVTQQEYMSFYSDLIKRLEDKIDKTLLPPNFNKVIPRSYYQIQSDIQGVHFEWGFHGRPRSSFGVELHFERSRKENNKVLFDIVLKHKDVIEKYVGESLIAQQDWGGNWSRIYFEKNEGNVTEELKYWAVDTMRKLYEVFYREVYTELKNC